MMHIHEYIFAALVIIAILLASNLMLAMVTEPLKIASERESLKRIAQSIMTQILLSPGDPINWGSNVTVKGLDLKSFGLAYQNRTTREAYVLDADKISRLNRNNGQFYIEPQRVSELLGLNIDEYGFTIEINAALNITVDPYPEKQGKYKINVKSVYGINPIQNATVYARIYYADNDQIYPHPSYCTVSNTTGFDGSCIIDLSENSENWISRPALAIFVVDYQGMRIPKVKVIGPNVTLAYLTGQTLNWSEPYSPQYVSEVIAPIRDGICEIDVVHSNVAIIYEDSVPYLKIDYVDPGTIAVLVAVDGKLIVAQRFMDLKYETRESSLGFMLEKMVLIEGFSYIVRLYVWRLVW